MEIELVRAGSGDREVLENLLSLYGHDFSEILGGTPVADGRYAYPRLGSFLGDEDRRAFLLRADGRLAGFALVSRGSALGTDPELWDMTEFFVVRGLRRSGVGTLAASAVFRELAGAWEVRVLELNQGALGFWQRAISSYTGGRYTTLSRQDDAGRGWQVYRFAHG